MVMSVAMRNRARCKLCESIIESYHRHDYVTCKCGEIAVDGGNDYWRVMAKDWSNFIRIDDAGNEIVPKVIDKEAEEEKQESLQSSAKQVKPQETPSKPSRKELIDMLDEMVKSYESLPQAALTMPITNYDLASALLLLSTILHAED